ncbi:MAG: 4-hydroxy-tetrahydrodipicolinate reductase [Bacteroidales bacterium]|nr:4-hydroxy-tetrahydrodipicolinate reductase [Bacteroidales bacterium]
MKIALIGYGKMGKEIEQIAISRGHEIVSIIDVNNPNDFSSDAFKSAAVAIEFTAPSVALENYRKCFAVGMPVVAGTTGWLAHLPEIKEACEKGNTFFYASNFSIGVNIFFAINKYLAKIMNQFPDYDVKMKEIHHIHKLDAPSGTAITLAEGVLENVDRKNKWALSDGTNSTSELAIEALREGEVPGYHSIIYDSAVDNITITHDAKSRKGFALGAVVAAEFTAGKKGFLSMDDMLKF